MKILISNTSNLAIYEQIIRQIKDAVIAKEIQEGEMLPSIRSLAKDLQISVITTKRAYEELEKEGLIYSVKGKGFYVSRQNTNMLKEKRCRCWKKNWENWQQSGRWRGCQKKICRIISRCCLKSCRQVSLKDMNEVPLKRTADVTVLRD